MCTRQNRLRIAKARPKPKVQENLFELLAHHINSLVKNTETSVMKK